MLQQTPGSLAILAGAGLGVGELVFIDMLRISLEADSMNPTSGYLNRFLATETCDIVIGKGRTDA